MPFRETFERWSWLRAARDWVVVLVLWGVICWVVWTFFDRG
jgi:hypothetical protein